MADTSKNAETANFLLLCLEHSKDHTIDWKVIGKKLNLQPGTASKRMSRLKDALAKGKNPAAEHVNFLWACVTIDDKMPNVDWVTIGAAMNLNPGTASKRLSRLKASKGKCNASKTSSASNAPALETPKKNQTVKSTASSTPKSAPAKNINVQNTSVPPPKSAPTKRNAPTKLVSKTLTKTAKPKPKVQVEPGKDLPSDQEEFDTTDRETSDSDNDAAPSSATSRRLSTTPSRAAKRPITYAESSASDEDSSASDTYEPEAKKPRLEKDKSASPSPQTLDQVPVKQEVRIGQEIHVIQDVRVKQEKHDEDDDDSQLANVQLETEAARAGQNASTDFHSTDNTPSMRTVNEPMGSDRRQGPAATERSERSRRTLQELHEDLFSFNNTEDWNIV